MTSIGDYLQTHAARFEEELCEFVRIPSVSADPARRGDIDRAAQWVAEQFRRLGLSVEIVPTAGHPLVYAESPPVAGAPTALVYGHYDVQPPDPLDLWVSPPFEPTRRDGNLYGRGASDDKGQVLTHLKGAEAWLKTSGQLPLQLKYIIEGEEEVGSHALEQFIRENAARLACHCVVISDGGKFSRDIPAITYGLRGIAYYEIRVLGPNRDLHSGSFGGSVTNPANALARILAALVDERGRICIPGFYEDVVPLTARERAEFAALPFDEARFRAEIGVAEGSGEEGYSTLERRWARPSCDVCGLSGGYQGQGAKTVLPAWASAKFSFRLVPHQDPHKITAALRRWLPGVTPPGVRVELDDHHGSPGVLVPLDSPYVAAGARAIAAAFGRPPVYTREGGSIPIVLTFHEMLKADTLLLGWGQDDDNAHSPNEKFSLADFHRGIAASASLWGELSKISQSADRPGKS
ncbi:MAG: dipeptidase [Thermoguttaceae bacterium]|jgi:succinyl-diaminopimelate desuccinylase